MYGMGYGRGIFWDTMQKFSVLFQSNKKEGEAKKEEKKDEKKKDEKPSAPKKAGTVP